MKNQAEFEDLFISMTGLLEECRTLQGQVDKMVGDRCARLRKKVMEHKNRNTPFRIVFCGVFSAGKTSLINTLLQCQYKLPVGVIPITKVVTHIHYGKNLSCSYLQDGELKKLNLNDTASIIRGEMALPENGEELFFTLPADILKGNIEFVDTPGFNDEMGGELEYMSRRAIAEADMAVVCCNALQLGKMFERSLLAELENTVGNYCLAVTRMDNLNTRREWDDIAAKAAWMMVGRGNLAMLEKGTGRHFLTVCGGIHPTLSGFNQYLKGILSDSNKRDAIRSSTDRLGMIACVADLSETAEKVSHQLELEHIHQKKPDKESSQLEAFVTKMNEMEDFTKSYCPQCGRKLPEYQIICPKCGKIHQMKVRDMSQDTQKILEAISGLVSRESADYSICWDMEARRIADIISKTKAIAGLTEMPGITSTLSNDLEDLIQQCRSAEFQIAIVGVMNAGKSMLMNALMGVEVASVNINPETAALTKFRSASGYYIKIKFHSGKEWDRLCASARESAGGKMHEMLEAPEIQKLSAKWLDHEEITVHCDSSEEMKGLVAHWTSARSDDHLFAAEVEVGIDRSIFDMPDEAVFVDTPGLHDPVQYRSDITKMYIRKANAVLIAVPTAALTTEGLGTITTVLDHVGSNKEKACIVATQKDKLNSRDCEKVMEGWVRNLVSAKRYKDSRDINAHLVVTSAYMYMQLRKFRKLTEEELENPENFSDDEYAELESYAKRTLGKRRYLVEDLRVNADDAKVLEKDSGIAQLHAFLERNLITKYRELKRQDIQKEYLRCRTELLEISQAAMRNQSTMLESVRKGAGELRKRLNESGRAYEEAKVKNAQIRQAVEEVKAITAELVNSL